MIHRSRAAPRSFLPFSFALPSSSPQCQFDPGRCRHHCRSSPHLPSSSSCACVKLKTTCTFYNEFESSPLTPTLIARGLTCFLTQQPPRFQHSTSLQTALDGCFFLLPCVGHLCNQLASQSIVDRKPDRT